MNITTHINTFPNVGNLNTDRNLKNRENAEIAPIAHETQRDNKSSVSINKKLSDRIFSIPNNGVQRLFIGKKVVNDPLNFLYPPISVADGKGDFNLLNRNNLINYLKEAIPIMDASFSKYCDDFKITIQSTFTREEAKSEYGAYKLKLDTEYMKMIWKKDEIEKGIGVNPKMRQQSDEMGISTVSLGEGMDYNAPRNYWLNEGIAALRKHVQSKGWQPIEITEEPPSRNFLKPPNADLEKLSFS